MSDLNPRGTTVEIGGKEERLLLSIRAVDKIQSETNLPLMDAFMKVAQVMDRNVDDNAMDVYVIVLTAMLQAGGSDVTEDDIRDTVHWKELYLIGRKMLEEFGISSPEEDEDEEDEDDDEDPKPATGA